MIPKASNLGRSFKEAHRYYSHDVGSPDTSKRVAWSKAYNLPTNDPNRGVAHMIDTAVHANDLKRAAGISNAGRKLELPVYPYAINWHPSENPTQQEQEQAVFDTIKALGLEDHQYTAYAHTDKAHPHVHVMVNRVHPETGKAAKLGNDHLKLSGWALQYEENGGIIFCKKRVENTERRKQEFVKDQSLTRKQHLEWKKSESDKLWAEYRSDRDQAKAGLKSQLDGLWQQRSERTVLRKEEIQQVFKPKWRDLYKQQRADLKRYDNRFSERLKFSMKKRQGSRAIAFARAIVNDGGNRRLFLQEQEKARTSLGQEQRRRISDAGREINKAWHYDKQQLLDAHKQQHDDRLAQTKTRSDQIWKPTDKKAATDFASQVSGSSGSKTQKATQKLKEKLKRDRSRKLNRPREPR